MYSNSLLLSYSNDAILNDDILTVADEEQEAAPLVRHLGNAERFHVTSRKEEHAVTTSQVAGEKKPADTGTPLVSVQAVYPPVLMPPQPEAYLKAGKYDFF